jgi:hypothetical protein
MTATTLPEFTILERNELDWDDEMVPVRYRVEYDMDGRTWLVRRTHFGAFITNMPLSDADLSEFRVTGCDAP